MNVVLPSSPVSLNTHDLVLVSSNTSLSFRVDSISEPPAIRWDGWENVVGNCIVRIEYDQYYEI